MSRISGAGWADYEKKTSGRLLAIPHNTLGTVLGTIDDDWIDRESGRTICGRFPISVPYPFEAI